MIGILQFLLITCHALSPNGTVEILIGVNIFIPSSVWTIKQRVLQLNQKRDLISPDAVVKVLYYNHTNNNLKAIQDSLYISNAGAIATISAATSARSVLASYIYQKKHIPQCCGASTSSELSSKEQYPNFFRTVPNDIYEGTAVLEFIRAQGWTYFAIVYVKDTWGVSAAAFVSSTAKNYNLTVLTQVGLEVGATDDSIYNDLGRILDFDARIIVYIGNVEYTQVLVQAKLVGVYGQGYAWIGFPGINKPVVKTSNSAGTIYIAPIERSFNPVTEEFEKLYQQDPDSTFPLVLNPATGLNTAQYDYFYASCIDTILYGFDRFLKADPTRTVQDLAQGIYNDQFKIPDTFNNLGIDTPSGKVVLNANGDRSGGYSYYFLNHIGNPIEIGTFDNVYKPKNGLILFPGNTTQKPIDYIRPEDIADFADPNSYIGTMLYTFFGVSLLVSVFSFVLTLYMNRNKFHTPGSDLKILANLCLIVACFQFLVMVGLPNDLKCGVDAVLMSISFSLFHSAVLVFNYRIYKIFSKVDADLQRAKFGSSPLLTALYFALPAVVIGAGWLGSEKPRPTLVRNSALEYHWTCSSPTSRTQDLFLNITVISNAGLLLLNCLLAIRCNYIQSSTKFIKNTSRVVMFNTSISLAGTLAIFVPGSSFEVRIVSKSIALFLIILFDCYEMFIIFYLKVLRSGKFVLDREEDTKLTFTATSLRKSDFKSSLEQKIAEKFAFASYKPIGGFHSFMGEQKLCLIVTSSKTMVSLFTVINKGEEEDDFALLDRGICFNVLYTKSYKCEVGDNSTLRLHIGQDSFELLFPLDSAEFHYWKDYFLDWNFNDLNTKQS